MTKVDVLEREIDNLNKEIRRYEQLGLTSDKYYICLLMEKYARISELEFCKDNEL